MLETLTLLSVLAVYRPFYISNQKLVVFLHFNYTSVLGPPYWIFSQCSVHASNDEESKNVRLLFLNSLSNQRTGPKLIINIIHTRNNAKIQAENCRGK